MTTFDIVGSTPGIALVLLASGAEPPPHVPFFTVDSKGRRFKIELSKKIEPSDDVRGAVWKYRFEVSDPFPASGVPIPDRLTVVPPEQYTSPYTVFLTVDTERRGRGPIFVDKTPEVEIWHARAWRKGLTDCPAESLIVRDANGYTVQDDVPG